MKYLYLSCRYNDLNRYVRVLHLASAERMAHALLARGEGHVIPWWIGVDPAAEESPTARAAGMARNAEIIEMVARYGGRFAQCADYPASSGMTAELALWRDAAARHGAAGAALPVHDQFYHPCRALIEWLVRAQVEAPDVISAWHSAYLLAAHGRVDDAPLATVIAEAGNPSVQEICDIIRSAR